MSWFRSKQLFIDVAALIVLYAVCITGALALGAIIIGLAIGALPWKAVAIPAAVIAIWGREIWWRRQFAAYRRGRSQTLRETQAREQGLRNKLEEFQAPGYQALQKRALREVRSLGAQPLSRWSRN